jgi:segregation and condensation protein B
VLYRTTPLFLKLFGLDDLDSLPEPTRWDPSPEEQAELRDRLLRAGDARSGVTPPTADGTEPAADESEPAGEADPEPEPAEAPAG